MRASFLVTTIALALAATSHSAAPSSRFACPVTIPTRVVPPGAGLTRAGFNFGGRHLRAHLYWPRGKLVAGQLPGGGSMASINPDGSISAKVGWWREGGEELTVRGRRLDAPAARLRASIPAGYGGAFQPTGLTFPTIGCWQVLGRTKRAELTFVVNVAKQQAR